MRRFHFFLLLFLIPALVYAFDHSKCAKLRKMAVEEWNRSVEIAAQLNHLNPDEGERYQHILNDAIDACVRATVHLDAILDDIAHKSRDKRHEYWRKEMKKACQEERDMCTRRLSDLKKVLEDLQKITKDNLLFEKAGVLYGECVKKTGLAKAEEQNCFRYLNHIDEVVKGLKKAAEFYEAASLDACEALDLVASTTREEDKAILQYAMEDCKAAADRCRQEADLWPEKILAQKAALKGDSSRLTESRSFLSGQEFRDREKKRRDLFYKNGNLLQDILQNELPSLAVPLDGYVNRKGKNFTLYTGQFYRFLFQSDTPVSRLLVRVYEEGKMLHEEIIAIPLPHTDAWERCLISDGMIHIPETGLPAFGLELRLQPVFDPDQPFSLILAQKASHSGCSFCISLDEETILYTCGLAEPPPWQLGVLRKPALPREPVAKLQPNQNPHFGTSDPASPQQTASFPLLDEFVKELGDDPLSLAAYVHNEIALAEPLLFQASGILRNPSMTWLEKRGSPWEQCQLLVYLLQKAGYRAAYACEGLTSLPKAFAEKMLFTKLPEEQTEALFNYPWVLFFDGKEWISLFPWIKEMQIQEGYDLYSLMPDAYASADRWILRYLKGDGKILRQIAPDGEDTAGLLFVRFVEEELRQQGLSLEDVGIHRTPLKKQFASWEDFPRPSIQSDPEILDSLEQKPELFARARIEISSHENPQKKQSYILPPEPVAFHFSSDGLHIQPKDREEQLLPLDASDRTIAIKVSLLNSEHTFSIDTETSATLCFHFGGGSPKITAEAHAQFSQEKEEQKQLHAFLAFIGAAYFEKCGRMEWLLADLHKTNPTTACAFGLAKLTSDSQGRQIPQVDMFWPPSSLPASRPFEILKTVDFSSCEHQIFREVFKDRYAISSVRLLQLAHLEQQKKGLPEEGFLVFTPSRFEAAEKNPEEAERLYFSHLKDLNLADVRAASPSGWDAVKSQLQSGNGWTYVYMTPGPVLSEDGTYKEMGTLILDPLAHHALISYNQFLLNGGLAFPMPKDDDDFKSYLNRVEYGENKSYSHDFSLDGLEKSESRNRGPNYNLNGPLQRDHHENHVDYNLRMIGPLEVAQYTRFERMLQGSSPSETRDWSPDVRADHKSSTGTVADPVDIVTGAFYIDEADLILPGSFPLEIRRNYNSQNPLLGDLGCGWKLSLNPFLIHQEDRWYAAEADGTIIAYRFNPATSRCEVFPEDNPDLFSFNKKGTGGSASPFHAYIENDILHGSDGSQRIFEEGLLKKWTNVRGNTLTFSYSEGRLVRIESSNGDFCGFHYNQDGRIFEICSGDGRWISYDYNSCGDLTRVTLPNGAVITYDYDSLHRIIRETKPSGRVLENIYDEEGRIIEQRSPVGPCQQIITSATFTYEEGLTTATDAAGGTTTYKIFQKQIYKITDPLGHQTFHSWFIDSESWFDPQTEQILPWKKPGAFPRSLKASSDKRGLVTSYLYDERGNPQEISLHGEDLTGDGASHIAKKLTYNSQNLCILEEVPGQKTITVYDSRFPFLPSRVEKYSGDSLISWIDLQYNAQGQITREEQSGAVTAWSYDHHGFPRERIQYTGSSDPDLITRYSYNSQGQCIRIAGIDSIQENSYDIMGNRIASELFSPSGQRLSATSIGYNLNCQPLWTRSANPDNILYIDYHASGAPKAIRQVTQEGTAYTLYDYDSRGCLIEEVDPLGNCIFRDYDALGRVERETKEGLSTLFSYEAGGLVESIRSPMGARTIRLYTSNGLLKEEVLPDGTSLSIIHDFFGRPVQETRDGITWNIQYDDPNHRVIHTHKATGTKEIQEYDPRGNPTRFTDAAGFTSEKTWDLLGRPLTETSPTGQQTSWSYDANTIHCTFPNGEKRTSTCEGGRLAASEHYDSQGNLIEQLSCHYDPEQDCQEIIHGEETTLTWMNALGQPLLVQKGELTATYTYDACGRCTTSTDGEGRTTLQTFDPLGQLVCKELPDGSQIRYAYDADSHLVECSLPNSVSWKADYDLMGRKCSEELQAGEETTQRWEYVYENGRLKEAKDPLQRTHARFYDPLGRCIREKVDSWQRSYTYDSRGLLLSAEQVREEQPSWLSSWIYAPKEERSLITRSYDPDGRLVLESVFLNSQLLQKSHQTWNPSGRSLQIEEHQRTFVYRNRQLAQVITPEIDLSYAYTLSGALKEKITPFGSQTIAYHPSSLPSEIHTSLPGGFQSESMEWDRSGKLILHTVPGSQKQFTYSPRGSLASAGDEAYTFDFGLEGTGVRTAAPHEQVPENGLDAFGRVIAETGNRIRMATIYNDMGQVVVQDKKKMEWDPWGRLVKVSNGTYTWEASYDALGRRLQTRYSSGWSATAVTTSLYDPEEEFQEIGVKQGGKTFWKIYGPQSCDAVTDEAGDAVVLMYNGLRQLKSLLVEGCSFHLPGKPPSAYGWQAPFAIPSGLVGYASTFSWQSQSTDPTGLIWMGARYYDPQTGRFLSPDPVGYPLCLDLYNYANGDPVNCFDPDGRYWSHVYEATKSTAVDTWNSPRFGGAMQALSGATEAYVGTALGITPFFPLGAVMLAHGSDHFATGLHTFFSGEPQTTATVQALVKAGVNPETAAQCDNGANFIGNLFGGGFVYKMGMEAAAFYQARLPAYSMLESNGQILFGQKSVSPFFSEIGTFKAKSISDVVRGLRNGTISPKALPIEVIVRNGQPVTLNNRSLLALRRAGTKPQTIINKTGIQKYESILDYHLKGSLPSDVIKIRGGPPGTSLIDPKMKTK